MKHDQRESRFVNLPELTYCINFDNILLTIFIPKLIYTLLPGTFVYWSSFSVTLFFLSQNIKYDSLTYYQKFTLVPSKVTVINCPHLIRLSYCHPWLNYYNTHGCRQQQYPSVPLGPISSSSRKAIGTTSWWIKTIQQPFYLFTRNFHDSCFLFSQWKRTGLLTTLIRQNNPPTPSSSVPLFKRNATKSARRPQKLLVIN